MRSELPWVKGVQKNTFAIHQDGSGPNARSWASTGTVPSRLEKLSYLFDNILNLLVS